MQKRIKKKQLCERGMGEVLHQDMVLFVWLFKHAVFKTQVLPVPVLSGLCFFENPGFGMSPT